MPLRGRRGAREINEEGKWSQPSSEEFTSITIVRKPKHKTEQKNANINSIVHSLKPTIIIFPTKELIYNIAEWVLFTLCGI